MDTRHLRAAAAVAEHGSFTRAARAMFMAQPTLSRHVRALERELGVKLFVRGPRQATLTAEGAIFLPRAQLALEVLGAGEAELRRATGLATFVAHAAH